MYAYIGLGANLGDRLTSFAKAAAHVRQLGMILRYSPIYETAPVGPPQPDYLNAALFLEAPMSPLDLLQGLLAIEAMLGRVRDPKERSAPRTMDLDVLLLGEGGQLVLTSPSLTVPHPRLHERTFALRPLLDLEEGLSHPLLAAPLRDLYEARIAHLAPTAPPRLFRLPPWPGCADPA